MLRCVGMMLMEEVRTVPAQEKCATGDTFTRQKMLAVIGYASSYASTGWKRLPHLLRVNLENKTWTS